MALQIPLNLIDENLACYRYSSLTELGAQDVDIQGALSGATASQEHSENRIPPQSDSRSGYSDDSAVVKSSREPASQEGSHHSRLLVLPDARPCLLQINNLILFLLMMRGLFCLLAPTRSTVFE